MIKNFITYLKWFFGGKPKKTVNGGWCGCCGCWDGTAEFTFREYENVDEKFDLITVCSDCRNDNTKIWRSK